MFHHFAARISRKIIQLISKKKSYCCVFLDSSVWDFEILIIADYVKIINDILFVWKCRKLVIRQTDT